MRITRFVAGFRSAVWGLLALGVATLATACGPPKSPQLYEEKASLEVLREECVGGNLKSCRYAHDRDETACRSRNDGKACWRAAKDFEQGLGIVADRDKTAWAVALACSNGVAAACTYAPNVGDGCWIGTACDGRCLGRDEVCGGQTPAVPGE